MFARRVRRGAAFIEVLLALVLLAIGGTALITLLGQTAHSMESLRRSEIETRAAAAELSALSVLSRADLVGREGRRRVHGWTLDITRTSASLFDARIAASDTGMVLLRTTLYRPDTSDASSP
ncbi:MAG TPA: hypothetical protein VIP11_08345 [Gemmatimonadaceae bacterium]